MHAREMPGGSRGPLTSRRSTTRSRMSHGPAGAIVVQRASCGALSVMAPASAER